MIPRAKLAGHLQAPSSEQVRDLAASEGVHLAPDDVVAMTDFISDTFDLLDTVEELPPLAVDLKFPNRCPGHAPSQPQEDPYNAFTRICHVEGAPAGPLAGRRIAVKDNLAVAGIPITNGSRTAGYTPSLDAVVVERMLEAGGTIVGKLNLDSMSAGAFGESSYLGPPRNPRNTAYSAGGSSGGAGAAVAGGLVDMALGVDQGGSARIPAAFCGCVAMKATHGLVPSFGLTYFDHTLDSICPMSLSVEAVAVLLEAIAGSDWRDPQWVREPVAVAPYSQAAREGVAGMRIGLLQETLDPARCQAAVMDGVRRAEVALRDAGAIVTPMSVPRVAYTSAIWLGAFMGGAAAMLRSDGLGYHHLGYVDVERVQLAGLSRRGEASSYGVFLQSLLIASASLQERYGHTFFARAQNQRLALRQELDAAFESVDLLLTPTCPTTAPRIPTTKLTVREQLERLPDAGVHFPYTQVFNLSGHPALVQPSGADEQQLPTSVQIVGRRLADYDVFKAAFTLQRAGFTMGPAPPPQAASTSS